MEVNYSSRGYEKLKSENVHVTGTFIVDEKLPKDHRSSFCALSSCGCLVHLLDMGWKKSHHRFFCA